MTTVAIYPGSFDPITIGHSDVIKRAANTFDQVIVLVMINPKKQAFFTLEQRVAFIEHEVQPYQNVRVDSFAGLLADYIKQHKATIIVRSFRNGVDIDYELPQALMNRELSQVETIFLPANPSVAHVSSSLVKEVAQFGGDIAPYVNNEVLAGFRTKET